jgi:hypothetical protein
MKWCNLCKILNRYKPYVDIAKCTEGEMKEKVAQNTVRKKRKLSVLLDDSTECYAIGP